MSPLQTALYFREWGKVREHYRAKGIDPKLCDAKRHELHLKALGVRKSSKDFTNADLDKVLAVFRAITRPDDLTAQLRQLDQPELRTVEARQACMVILAELGIGRGEDSIRADWLRGSYLNGIVKRISGKLNFSELSDRQANHLLHTLRLRRIAQEKAQQKHRTVQVDESVPF